MNMVSYTDGSWLVGIDQKNLSFFYQKPQFCFPMRTCFASCSLTNLVSELHENVDEISRFTAWPCFAVGAKYVKLSEDLGLAFWVWWDYDKPSLIGFERFNGKTIAHVEASTYEVHSN